MTITTPVIAGMAFPRGIRPISNITPFTYRDGLTYLRVLEELIAYVNSSLTNELNVTLDQIVSDLNTSIEEMEAQIVANEFEYAQLLDQYMTDMQSLVDSINNRVGNEQIQRVTIDDDYAVTLDPNWPTAHPIGWQITQDSTGGHDVTFTAPIVNPDGIMIDLTPGATTEFWITPQPDGSWVVSSDAQMLSAETVARIAGDDALDTAITAEEQARITAITAEEQARIQAIGSTVQGRFTYQYVPTAGAVKEHFRTFVHGVLNVPYSIVKTLGNPTSGTHVRKSMADFVLENGCNLVTNASGWRGNGNMMGLQILNGVLLRGWDTDISYDGKGRVSLVVMRDGSFKIYDANTTPDPETIISDGGWNSFTWGIAAVRDGVAQPMPTDDGYDTLSGRHVIGDLLDGRILIASFPGISGSSGATGQDVLNSLTEFSFNNLYFLDGGGSTQMYVDGYRMIKSSDTTGFRDVADVMGFKGASANQPIELWNNLTDRQNGATGGGISYYEGINGVEVRVQSVDLSAVTLADQWVTIATMPESVERSLYSVFTTEAWASGAIRGLRVTTTRNIDVYMSSPGGLVSGYVTYNNRMNYR